MYIDAILDKKSDVVKVVERVDGKRVYKDHQVEHYFYVSDKDGKYKNIYNEPVRKLSPRGWVKKPIFSREGANIAIIDNDGYITTTSGPYTDCAHIWQKYNPLPNIGGNFPIIGSWIVGDRACGMGIREDSSIITQDTSRFVPHIITQE